MKKAIAIGIVLLLVVGLAVGYHMYDTRYLSSELKRTLTAGMDENASEADINAYIRDARLQVHTKRDAEVLQKFERLMNLSVDASETQDRLMREGLRSMHEMTTNSLNMSKQEFAAYLERQKQSNEINAAEEKRASEEATTAQKMYTEMRSILGLSPLSSTK